MGTNFYTTKEPPCDHCGRGGEEMHIGKSSGGWKFLFAPYPDDGLTSWLSWQEFLIKRTIKDEYGRVWSLKDFIDLVEGKQTDDNWDHENAPDEVWGPCGRNRHFKDDSGYRFSDTADFS